MSTENTYSDLNQPEENFGLPENYFKSSAKAVFTKIEWLEEHKDLLKLLELKEKLSVKNYGFKIPENYFEIKGECLENIKYPGLESRMKTSGFTVPENYFHTTETNLVTQLQLPKEGRVLYLFIRRLTFAAAAMVLLSLGFWIYNSYFIKAEIQDCKTVACVEKNELVKALNFENLETDELYELVNPTELKQVLEEEGQTSPQIKLNDTDLKKISSEELLDEI